MSATVTELQAWAQQVKRRYAIGWAGEALLAGGAVAAWLAWLVGAMPGVAFGVVSAALWYSWREAIDRRVRRFDADAVARCLDDAFAQLEDSATLLLKAPESLPTVATLQQVRVARTLDALPRADIEQALPRPRGGVSMLLAVVAFLGLLSHDAFERDRPGSIAPRVVSSPDDTVRIEAVTIDVVPPAYTGRSPYAVDGRDVEVLEGSTLQWRLALRGAVDAPALQFHDGERVRLERRGGVWLSPPLTARQTVYRIDAGESAADEGGFSLVQVVPDRPPQFTVHAPGDGVTQIDAGGGIAGDESPMLSLDVSVRDDFGLIDAAARVTLASGSGENVRFRERVFALASRPGGTDLLQRFSRTFDPAALGMEPGDELYLFVEARDNRQPAANVARSRTYIVRWSGEEVLEMDAVDVMVMRVMPEFFRSQRQIIIDTEGLLAEAGDLDVETFGQRSQTIAFDQKALRLRYGTFLGEESVSDIGPGPSARAETEHEDHDHGVESTDGESDGHDEHLAEEEHYAGDGHDHAGEPAGFGRTAGPVFGQPGSAMAAYMHTHDIAEQATLFDPQTRDLLKSALAQMWDAELQLRLRAPAAALPFEYRALELIKRVQQRSRIYLKRVGFRTTPPDEARRLSGELADVSGYTTTGSAGAPQEQQWLREALAALSAGASPAPEALAAVRALLLEQAGEQPQVLGALAALERLAQDPACSACATRAATALWPLIDVALAPAETRRAPMSVIGERFRAAGAGEAGR
jgi:predicted outer membrane lipoprotein